MVYTDSVYVRANTKIVWEIDTQFCFLHPYMVIYKLFGDFIYIDLPVHYTVKFINCLTELSNEYPSETILVEFKQDRMCDTEVYEVLNGEFVFKGIKTAWQDASQNDDSQYTPIFLSSERIENLKKQVKPPGMKIQSKLFSLR